MRLAGACSSPAGSRRPSRGRRWPAGRGERRLGLGLVRRRGRRRTGAQQRRGLAPRARSALGPARDRRFCRREAAAICAALSLGAAAGASSSVRFSALSIADIAAETGSVAEFCFAIVSASLHRRRSPTDRPSRQRCPAARPRRPAETHPLTTSQSTAAPPI